MLVGRVSGAFGVRGEIKVGLDTDFPDRFTRVERVYLGPGRKEYTVEKARRHGDRVLLKLAGIDTPEAVRALGTVDIYVPRDEAVELPDGHYYLDDLIGARVSTVGGDAVGEIEEVLQTGGNDVFVVRTSAGPILIPSIKDAVVELDVADGRVVVEPWVLEPV